MKKEIKLKYFNFRVISISILIILGITLLYKGMFANILKRRQFLKTQAENLQKELDYLKNENLKLKGADSKETDEEYLEKESRLSLGFKKEGETVVVLNPGTSTSTTKPNTNDLSGSINKMIDFIKGLFK